MFISFDLVSLLADDRQYGNYDLVNTAAHCCFRIADRPEITKRTKADGAVCSLHRLALEWSLPLLFASNGGHRLDPRGMDRRNDRGRTGHQRQSQHRASQHPRVVNGSSIEKAGQGT